MSERSYDVVLYGASGFVAQQEVCAHYRLQATRNNLGVAHENGAIEASHGHFKRRLKQSLLLRGSFDFATVSEYQSWIETVIAKMNAKCNEKFIQEQQVLQSLPKYRYPDYEVLSAKVSQYSTLYAASATMAGVYKLEIQESAEELKQLLRAQTTATGKERLQVLYLL
ncbi:MAG: hypothetical protein J0L70_31525, partial [Leptolyngbya sp. UWPOB_LEPTO1]|nr:hypothetical protein [Leptolyngbya sp. UWPOB_LEPTO1]